MLQGMNVSAVPADVAANTQTSGIFHGIWQALLLDSLPPSTTCPHISSQPHATIDTCCCYRALLARHATCSGCPPAAAPHCSNCSAAPVLAALAQQQLLPWVALTIMAGVPAGMARWNDAGWHSCCDSQRHPWHQLQAATSCLSPDCCCYCPCCCCWPRCCCYCYCWWW